MAHRLDGNPAELLEALRASLADRYRIERQIGQGGMATVFAAEDLRYGRSVAMKVLNPELASSMGAERFQREINVLARLNHPHILPVLDSGDVEGLLFYVMPLVGGESLRDRIDREGALGIDEAVGLICEVMDALSHAHGFGIIHRDIKPDNILLHGGHAVVADFGIARLIQDASAGGEKLTQTGMSMGTAAYMSPEQAAGETADMRSDVYSLGCVLYEMLVGEAPFTGPNAMAIMARHTMEAPRSIRVVRGTVPEELEDVVMQALEKAPADRFRTVFEFRSALLGESMSVTQWRGRRAQVAPASGAAKRRQVSQRRAVIAIGLVLAVGVGAATWRALGVQRSAGTVGPDARDVAVLYFQSEGDPALKTIADGLSESLIDALSSVPALHVVSRNGVARFRSANAVDSAAKTLGVGSIVTGTVRAQGDHMHVEVRLVDAASNADVGTRGFDVATAGLTQLRDSLASQVAEFLRQQLGHSVQVESRRQETSAPQAWLALQRGMRRRRDADSLTGAGVAPAAAQALSEADAAFADAARRDAKWAAPLAQRAFLAVARARASASDAAAQRAAIDSGVAVADRALELDSRSADALEARGTLRFLSFQQLAGTNPSASERDLAAAEKDLTAATAANPTQASAWATLSLLYLRKQSVQESNLAAQNAYRADAYLASTDVILSRLFWTSFDMESFQDAQRWCLEGRRRFPAKPFFVECQLRLMTTKLVSSDPDRVWKLLDTMDALIPPAKRETDGRAARIVVAMALARDPALADSARRLLLRTRPPLALDPRHELAGQEAIARVYLHDYDEAVSLIQTYLTSNPEHARGFKTNTAWWWRDPGLQNHPKFRALIAGIR